jgi:hypothetical protein
MVVFKIAQEFGLGETGQFILWPVTAAVVFPLAHWTFNKWIWKWSRVSAVLKIPNLNGAWRCDGITTSGDPNIKWRGSVVIDQSWEKIKIFLKTESSSSHSISAALLHDSQVGYRLMYSYRNSPKMGQGELASHVGYCELLFDEKLTQASGDYFNNFGRTTSGRMTLTRGQE